MLLVGREAEQRRLDSLLSSAREEHSAVLVLRGAPGIGKTALLEYAEGQAGDMEVLRCVGIEAEHELPFAGLHQLVRPHLDLVERLPAPQATALNSALGLSSDGVDDRFLVSLGLLSLLAEICEETAVLCCVDDAQWLDAPSAEALLFAARRLHAERVAMVIAVRDGVMQRFDAPGLPALELEGLDEADAEALLTRRLEGHASPDVVSTLLRTARGNPLALLELPAALSTDQLEGAEPILGPPPVRPAVEESFRARVDALPDRTRRLLLVAAADELGDPTAIREAARQLGLDASDLDEAERNGLVRVNGSVEFRHPLVRSAIYRSASRSERKAVHEALAACVADEARSAWHRALVADGADEGIAAELEAAGVQAVTRGAQATASAAFERAAELSVDPTRRGHRFACAAQASLDAGRPDVALALAERAASGPLDPLDGVALALVRATDAGRRGSPMDGYALMREAAGQVAEVNREVGAELVIFSFLAAIQGGWASRTVPELLDELDRIGAEGEVARFTRFFLQAGEALLAGDAALARDRFRAAREVGAGLRQGRPQVLNAFVCGLTGDYPEVRRVTTETIAGQRAQGSLSSFVGIFPLLAIAEVYDGRLGAALAATAEGLELAERFGYENDITGCRALQAHVAAQQGREAECRELAREAMQRSLAKGLGWATQHARVALGELELGLGNLHEALTYFDQLDATELVPAAPLATPEVIDAALRLGDRERADAALERFEAWAPVSDAPLVAGLLARCRAILSERPTEAEPLFEEALEVHGRAGLVYQRARTQLAYGEWLRRERRKVDARAQLRTALDTFEGLGMKLWAERALGELKATGETARKRDVTTLDDLTPQELRIAQLVAAGATNRDAAAQLFVSPKTVEYHLRKVFTKLGVSSRVELARVPLGEPSAEPLETAS
jgi:DNA-binding CsgD family transcriptional regulator/tetratricopeptide (TPR) repeat protein